MALAPLVLDTLQVNVTRTCNQVCRHCHVDASPSRTEKMSPEVMAKCLEILARHPQIAKLDVTGGAPELHPEFDDFVRKAVALGKQVIKAGVLVADVAGHDFTDAARALMLHQVFHTGALYEMDMHGQITTRLFEQINTRFCKSATLRNLAADRDAASFITLIYGEISNTGRFSFVSAGHPPPLVFSREFDRFVEVSQDRLVSYPPIGLQPGEHHAGAKRYERALGYKKRYTVNNLNLMGHGDVLLLYTDGLIEPLSAYTQDHLAHAVSRAKDGSAQAICEAIVADRQATTTQTDDLTLIVIKYR